jgi:hypothetical protein
MVTDFYKSNINFYYCKTSLNIERKLNLQQDNREESHLLPTPYG